MAKGVRKSKEEKFAADIQKIDEKLKDISEKKEKILAPLMEKESELLKQKKIILEQLDAYKKEVVMNSIVNSKVPVDKVAELIGKVEISGLAVEDILKIIDQNTQESEAAATAE